MQRPYSAACERNREPILAALRDVFADARHVLEIGSGTGQHAAYFAAAMPHLQWHSSDAVEHLDGIRAWLDEAGLPNAPAPIALQSLAGAGLRPLPGRRFDAVFSANTLHIMGWPEVQALFASLPDLLEARATLAVYGPFNRAGGYTSDSNREFDGWLKARDPRSGIRDFEAVDGLARAAGLQLALDAPMPANNVLLAWRR